MPFQPVSGPDQLKNGVAVVVTLFWARAERRERVGNAGWTEP